MYNLNQLNQSGEYTMRIAISALALTCALPAYAEVAVFPTWPTASCLFTERQHVVFLEEKVTWDEESRSLRTPKVMSVMHDNTVDEFVHIRWLPGTHVELFCGERFIMIVTEESTFIEIMIPR